MSKITYALVPAHHIVYLDGRYWGDIKKTIHETGVATWRYHPKGSKDAGEAFNSLGECKASLEDA